MVAPLGRTLILAALAVATIGAVVAFAAGSRDSREGVRWARRMAYAFAGLMIAANFLMVYALLAHDFSVSYVAQVGSRLVPTWVSIVSLWSSLEGSILFWGFILGVYVAGATRFLGDRYPEYTAYAIGMMLACGVFFAFLIAGPANPFHTVPNPPADGPGPNPLLQNHILMVIHPPTLYLGYVGMTVPFSLAAAALLTGRLGHDFLRPLRLWLLIPWTFLTAGIVLGGWWAYEVLGWGGYWAWDPVENASFLPWLTATAAVHSVLVVERRGMFKGWTVTLILASFLLTILGTFMTRSGVFNSVHSFTQSDIGPTFLGFLAVGLLFSVLLLSARIGVLEAESKLRDEKSREGAIMLNNLLFVMFTFTVLLGTVFPLITEAVRGLKITVGEPYFNKLGVPNGVAILFLMGIGPALPWGKASWTRVRNELLPPLNGGAAALGLGLALGMRNPWALVTLFCGGFTLWVSVVALIRPLQRIARGQGHSVGDAVRAQLSTGRRRTGGYLIHVGVVLVIVAIAISSTERISTEATLRQGQSLMLGEYQMTFLGMERVNEGYRQSDIAQVQVSRDGEVITILRPRMNNYATQREPIGTPEVYSTLLRDVYLSVMSSDAQKQILGLRAFVNPGVYWIWIGTGVMLLGAAMSMWPQPRRRRASQRARQASQVDAEGATARP